MIMFFSPMLYLVLFSILLQYYFFFFSSVSSSLFSPQSTQNTTQNTIEKIMDLVVSSLCAFAIVRCRIATFFLSFCFYQKIIKIVFAFPLSLCQQNRSCRKQAIYPIDALQFQMTIDAVWFYCCERR